jgi:hypothetical protein
MVNISVTFIDEAQGQSSGFSFPTEDANGLHIVSASVRGTIPFNKIEPDRLFQSSHTLFLIDDGSFFPNAANAFRLESPNFCEACRILIERSAMFSTSS